MTSVELIDVAKTFATEDGEVVAVDRVTLTLKSGDRLGIIGPNGAGKSTLLQMIAGLVPPTGGAVQVNGRVTAVMTLGIGLRDQVSGRENIYLDGELQGLSRAEIDRLVDPIIEFTELGDFIDQPVRTYSTGMKARLSFAMLSHLEPEILIIDEALSVGDAAFSRKAAAKIREICARGHIVIIVSHSLTSVRDICNRCLWMDHGRIVEDGKPEDVTQHYLETVRQADRRDAVAKFRKMEGERSFVSGWSVSVALSQGAGGHPRMLESGQPLFIQVSIGAGNDRAFDVDMTLVRLDGAMVFRHRADSAGLSVRSRRARLCVAMEPLVLGAGIYRLDIALNTEGTRAAECSLMFEVFEPVPRTGGRPMLAYPVHVDVTELQSR